MAEEMTGEKTEKLRSWHRHSRIRSSGHYARKLINNVFQLTIINMYMFWIPWTHGAVTGAWSNALWAMDLSLAVQLAGHLLLIGFHPRWMRNLADLLFSATGLLAAVIFFSVFPLDFAKIGHAWLDTLFKVLTIIGIVGASIAVIVTAIRFVFTSWRPEEETE